MHLEPQGRLDRSHTEFSQGQTMFLTKSTMVDIPLNLGDWVEPITLMEWVRAEVEKLDGTQAYVKDALDKPPECRPRTMLALLALGYSLQIFRSQEIVAACHSDAVFRELCGSHPPFAEELEHFRRTHRRVVDGVLAQVLLRAVALRFNYGTNPLPPGLVRNLHFRAEERTDIARHMSAWDD